MSYLSNFLFFLFQFIRKSDIKNLIFARAFSVEFVRQVPKSFFGTQYVTVIVDVFELDVRLETILFFEIGRRSVEAISSAELVVVSGTKNIT